MDKGHLKISDVKFKGENGMDVPPLIVYFENGTLKSNRVNDPQCAVYRDNDDPEKYVAAVCTQDNSLYMGNEPDKGPYRTLLAVQVPGTRKVQLVEVDKVWMKPQPSEFAAQLAARTFEPSGYANLYREFGSKKIIRKTDQRERMSFNVESFANRLNDTVSEIKLDNSLNIMDNIDYYGTFLPCNQDAPHVNDVYNLEDLISLKELGELNNEALAVLENTEQQNAENYSEFFNENLKLISDDNKVFHTGVLLYAECIVQFLMLPLSEMKKKKPLVCPLSCVINDKLLKEFCEMLFSGRGRSTNMKNKAISYAIVAGLIACNYSLCVAPLSPLLKMPLDKLLKISRSLGALPVPFEDKSVIALKVPLPLPPKKKFIRK